MLIEVLGTSGRDDEAIEVCKQLEGRLESIDADGGRSKTMAAGHYFILAEQYRMLQDRSGYARCQRLAKANAAGKADEKGRWKAVPWRTMMAA
jgi:hypothetical protein